MELINRGNILRYIADLQYTAETDAERGAIEAVWRCVSAAVDYSGVYMPVVRCKDCVYYAEVEPDFCKWRLDELPNEDDYCSYGERRTE